MALTTHFEEFIDFLTLTGFVQQASHKNGAHIISFEYTLLFNWLSRTTLFDLNFKSVCQLELLLKINSLCQYI